MRTKNELLDAVRQLSLNSEHPCVTLVSVRDEAALGPYRVIVAHSNSPSSSGFGQPFRLPYLTTLKTTSIQVDLGSSCRLTLSGVDLRNVGTFWVCSTVKAPKTLKVLCRVTQVDECLLGVLRTAKFLCWLRGTSFEPTYLKRVSILLPALLSPAPFFSVIGASGVSVLALSLFCMNSPGARSSIEALLAACLGSLLLTAAALFIVKKVDLIQRARCCDLTLVASTWTEVAKPPLDKVVTSPLPTPPARFVRYIHYFLLVVGLVFGYHTTIICSRTA